MVRKIIQIDEEKCNGCGLCAEACHEAAIVMVNKKATLLRDDYCDGLGDCLPACPTGAISFIEREAAAYDEEAVMQNKHQQEYSNQTQSCRQWPLQIKLMPITAPYFEQADLLVAADCTAYAYARFQEDFMKNKITIIGCPKLDQVDYCEKLTEIIRQNNINSVTIARMEVPCCGGLEQAVKNALQASGKFIPWQIATISVNGELLT